MSIDAAGNLIYCSAYQTGANRTFALYSLDNSSGSTNWSLLFSNVYNADEYPYLMYLTPAQKLYVAGTKTNSMFIAEMVTNPNTQSVNYSRSNLNKPISDLQFTYDTINVNINNLPPTSIVNHIILNIDTIQHPMDNDLEIVLLHQGYSDTVIYRRGNGPNFIATILDDTAQTHPICGSNAFPFTGIYQPCNPLTKLNNLSPNGPWVLKIYDRRTPNAGILKAWGISIKYTSPIGIREISGSVPNKLLLRQNYPNPFNPSTRIKFDITKAADTKLLIFDILGRKIVTLVNQQLTPGTYEADWDASSYASGVYFYQLVSGDFVESKKMILVK